MGTKIDYSFSKVGDGFTYFKFNEPDVSSSPHYVGINVGWDREVFGIWVAKYTTGIESTSGSTNGLSLNTTNTKEYDKMYLPNQTFKPVSKPYYITWRNISYTNAFSQSMMFYKYVTNKRDINTHLMKYSEYSIVDSLRNSKVYGNFYLESNTQNRYAGGSDGKNGYSITNFQNQSTNGNITGIYDFSHDGWTWTSEISFNYNNNLYRDIDMLFKTNSDYLVEYDNYKLKNKYFDIEIDTGLTSLGNENSCGVLLVQGAQTPGGSFTRTDAMISSTINLPYENNGSRRLDGNNTDFRVVLINSPSGSESDFVYDYTNKGIEDTTPGFFVTDKNGNMIRNTYGEYKDTMGNPTFYSWQEMLDNNWIRVIDDELLYGSNINELKNKTGILNIKDGVKTIRILSFAHWYDGSQGDSYTDDSAFYPHTRRFIS